MAKKLLEIWQEGTILLIKAKLAWLVDVTSEEEMSHADAMDIANHIMLYQETLDVPDNSVGWVVKYNYEGEGEGEVIDIEPLSAEVLATINPS